MLNRPTLTDAEKPLKTLLKLREENFIIAKPSQAKLNQASRSHPTTKSHSPSDPPSPQTQPGTSRSRLPPYGTLSIENWQVFYGPSVIGQINVTSYGVAFHIEICPLPHFLSHWMHGAWFCVSESLSPQALPRLKKDLLPLLSHDTWWVSWGGGFFLYPEGIIKTLSKMSYYMFCVRECGNKCIPNMKN
jgi:hypothetical protein